MTGGEWRRWFSGWWNGIATKMYAWIYQYMNDRRMPSNERFRLLQLRDLWNKNGAAGYHRIVVTLETEEEAEEAMRLFSRWTRGKTDRELAASAASRGLAGARSQHWYEVKPWNPMERDRLEAIAWAKQKHLDDLTRLERLAVIPEHASVTAGPARARVMAATASPPATGAGSSAAVAAAPGVADGGGPAGQPLLTADGQPFDPARHWCPVLMREVRKGPTRSPWA